MSSHSLQLWEYHDPAAAARAAEAATLPVVAACEPPLSPGLSEIEVQERVRRALAEEEMRWSARAVEAETARRAQLERSLEDFSRQRQRYFRAAEQQVVQLVLAIARKLLLREAALDPDLLAGLVRVALDQLSAGPQVTLYVAAADHALWAQSRALQSAAYECVLAIDPTLGKGECRAETDLGTADLGLQAQLRTVEQGMLELLQMRPPLAEISQSPAETRSAA